MKIAVTGATGMVGGQVVSAALAAGHEVVAIARPDPERRGNTLRVGGHDVPRAAAALTDTASLTRALRGCDGLIHCAAVYAFGAARAAEVDQVNTDGTRAVIEAAAAAEVSRVVVTTSSVTCGSSLLPRARSEDDHLGVEPAPAYYASKVAQEEVALETGQRHGIPVVLALPTVVLGGPFIRLAPSNAIVLRYLLDPTRSTFAGGCNVVDARDVGAGHIALLEHGSPGERYLLGGEDLSWRMLHSLVADLAGLPGPFAEMPAASAWALSAAAEWWAGLSDSTPLTTREEASTVGRFYWYTSARAHDLGYAARPARAAVAASLAWLAVSPDLPRWAREGLRLHPEVRAARDLVGAPLAAADDLSPRPRRSPPAWPRRRR
ncbi:NAD-dependent epimerase/dehydratase family protein [Pedococcus bigeumensis]|uniref:NAD-dependent epimerase/dehydratase family protein n=1 Tax=Pedococcus bigeumensis TaxID=433644 RepID=A0A502CMV3_9MICO|nr:NAD-dependent epimerase/dehydratase family protein [Pedococcus bigeumensis]TPG15005.1 NAD-dependent epimerase/dehydratase family protein [Pedococcus bigeumensis]